MRIIMKLKQWFSRLILTERVSVKSKKEKKKNEWSNGGRSRKIKTSWDLSHYRNKKLPTETSKKNPTNLSGKEANQHRNYKIYGNKQNKISNKKTAWRLLKCN